MKFVWNNYTQVAFGQGVVRKFIPKYVRPGSKVLCTFGCGSCFTNGSKTDLGEALDTLNCVVRWEGGIMPNPEYERCMEIVQIVKEFQPDLLIALGGGSVFDATKFICLAAKMNEGEDPYDMLTKGTYPSTAFSMATVLTMPATGSEWNNNFVISRRAMNLKLGGSHDKVYPQFSLLDPKYTMTLPVRQLRNGVFDAMTHVIDQFVTQEENFMFDSFWISIFRELVEIGPEVIKEGSSIELHERLIIACSFALNLLFSLGKPGDWTIHLIGNMITEKYGIDHGATLALTAQPFLDSQKDTRKNVLARIARECWHEQGSADDQADACVRHIREFIAEIGMPTKVSEYKYADLHPKPEDIDELVRWIMDSNGGASLGAHGEVTADTIRSVLEKIIC